MTLGYLVILLLPSQPPRLQHKLSQKLWTKRESSGSREEKEEDQLPSLKPQKENVQKEDEEPKPTEKAKKEIRQKTKEKPAEKTEKSESESRSVSPKTFAPFFEVNVKQEEEDEDETSSDPPGESNNHTQ